MNDREILGVRLHLQRASDNKTDNYEYTHDLLINMTLAYNLLVETF